MNKKLTSLRETILEAIADTRRYSIDDVRANLKAHFEQKRSGRKIKPFSPRKTQ